MSVNQKVLKADQAYTVLDTYFGEKAVRKVFLVCGKSFSDLRISKYFNTLEKKLGIEVVRFSGFGSNPQYESVADGVRAFKESGCDMIIAVGGGSAMDVAKCIKLYSNMNSGENYLTQPIIPQDIPLLAVPTTAGSGSEATRYAVIYYNGEKQSITHESCIPSAVLLDASALESLPDYHKKSAMLDALCHAVESFWSVNSTEESMRLSKEAIRQIFVARDRYLAGDVVGNLYMLMAADTAGKAINIAQTTAGHAMCYKLTSLYGIAHGHAAALCTVKLFKYMVNTSKGCNDPRGMDHLGHVFSEIAEAMGCESVNEATVKFSEFVRELDLDAPIPDEKDWEILRNSVNWVRLKNNPVKLEPETIDMLYHEILGKTST